MFVDDIEGTTHRAYGCLPNMVWVIDTRGRISYRADWTDARTVDRAVEQLVWEEEQRRNGATLAPFECDWAPRRVRNRKDFVHGLLDSGPRAFEEFLAAARASKWPRSAIQELLDGLPTED